MKTEVVLVLSLEGYQKVGFGQGDIPYDLCFVTCDVMCDVRAESVMPSSAQSGEEHLMVDDVKRRRQVTENENE